MNRTIRTLTLAVTLLLFAVLLPQMDAEAAASGTCGDNLTWTLDDAGTLTISGMGDMVDGTRTPFYSYLSQIKKAVILNGVTNIGNYAFRNCTNLTSVTIPDGVTSISDSAFSGCRSLTSVTIPDSVESIGISAFEGCSSLTSVTIPDGVTSIGMNAFRNAAYCNDENNWNNGVLYIGNCLIQAKNDLIIGHCEVREGTVCISDYAFLDCRSLTSVTIPDSVTSIGRSAFSGCRGLARIHITDLKAWCNINGLSNLTGVSKYDLFLNDAMITELVLPYGLTSISNYAFWNCNGLTSVTIPDSVTWIGREAFRNCSGLASVTIPDSVTSIGEYAFYGCDELTDVYFDGTEADWNNITIAQYNDPLTSATIHYNSGGSEGNKTVMISDPVIVTDGGAPACQVTIFCPEDQTAVAFGVRYSAENRFIGFESLDLIPGQDNEMTVRFGDGSYVRILVLDASTFVPLCAGSAAVAKP